MNMIDPAWGSAGDLPLGVLLGTARLAACVPMVDRWHNDHPANEPCLAIDGRGDRPGMMLVDPFQSPVWTDVSDQRPFGDFRPGRWAWLLDDIIPTIERCPACDGKGWVACAHDHHDDGRVTCPTCDHYGRCDPIPARGGQRVWYWTPERAA